MKKLLFVASLVLTGCNAPETATLVVKADPNSEVMYWGAGKDELCFYDLGEKDTINADGCWVYQTTLTDSKVLAVNVSRKVFNLYLTPGSCDTLTVSKDTVMLEGDNSAYNRCLQAVDEYQNYCDRILILGGKHELKSVTTPDELKFKNGVHYDKAANIIRHSGLSASFVEEQIAHLDFISRQIVAYITMYSIQDKTDEWKKELRIALESPWNEEAIRSYRRLDRMAMQLAPMKFFILENGDRSSIKEPYRFIYERSKELFEGKTLERILAYFIYDAIFQQNKDEAFIGIFEEFKQQYPDSPYLSTLQPGIEELIRYHQGELNEDIYHIIPYDANMTSISEAVKQFRGKVVYVDVWATWCGPCKKMFSYVPAFKEKAKELDVVYLYLSIDNPQAEKVWRKSIPYYDLKGYHLLAGKELAKAVYQELGDERGTLSIPRFLIIGKDGKIAVSEAASPDQPEKVIEQLKQVIVE